MGTSKITNFFKTKNKKGVKKEETSKRKRKRNEKEDKKTLSTIEPENSKVKKLNSGKPKAVEVVQKDWEEPVFDGKLQTKRSGIKIEFGKTNVVEKESSKLWTDKYKPKTIDELVGNENKIELLAKWLSEWESNFLKKKVHETGKETFHMNPKYENNKTTKKLIPEIGKKKAALLSGVAGIGKTSTARIVCELLGFIPIEFNASDTRSRKALKKTVFELSGNNTLSGYFGSQKDANKPTCLIMDEVDGMSSGDRGGVSELVKIIAKSKVPIICICNDKQQQNLKTLIKHSFHLPFSRPVKTTIRKRIKKICQKEKIVIPDSELMELIETLGNDIRCIINQLQFRQRTLRNDIIKTNSQKNIFTVAHDVLGSRDSSIAEQTSNYFFDSGIIPLFVQENYLNLEPTRDLKLIKKENESQREFQERRDQIRLDRIRCASSSISNGDLIDVRVRRDQNWTLTPHHAIHSVALPAFYVHGKYKKLRGNDGFTIRFPSSLGKGSSHRKNVTLLNTMTRRLQSKTNIAREDDLLLDASEMLLSKITTPLKNQEIEEAIKFMLEYNIEREDVDVLESWVSLGGKYLSDNAFKSVPTKLKTAFTRAYKKVSQAASSGSGLKKSSNVMTLDQLAGEDDMMKDDYDDEEEKVEEKNDLFSEVKKRKVTKKKKKTTTKKKKK